MRKFSALFAFLGWALSAGAQVNITALSNMPYAQELSAIWGYTAPNGTEYALVGTRTRVSIVSLANPAAPVEVASVPGPTTSWRELKTWGNYAYVGLDNVTSGLLIINLSNLPNGVTYQYWQPVLNINGTNHTLLRVHTVTMDEKGILILNGTNILSGRPLLFDVSVTPNAPQFLGTVGTVYVHDSYARGDTLWTGDIYNGRFSVWNIANKAAPVLLGQQNTPSNFTHNIWPNRAGTHVFTTDEVANAYVAAYDVSDLTNITEVDRFRTRETALGHIPHNVHVRNDYVVTAYYTEGLRILDGHRPHNLVEVGWYDTYTAANVGFYGDWGLYPDFASGNIIVSDINTGLWVLQPNYVRACYLEGKITDAYSCQPVIGASVRLMTNPNGVASANVFGDYATGFHAAGTYSVVVSAPGYQTATVQATITNGQVTWLNVALVPNGCTAPNSILFVNDDAAGNGSGNCWGNAYTDLQTALSAAQPGQQIWVAQGTYKPTTGANRGISFSLKSGVAVYGGFPDNGACSVQQRDWEAYPTRLSGNIGNPNLTTDNSYRVVTAINVGADCVLDGFRIENAYSNTNGGGIAVQANVNGAQSSPALRRLRITDNYTPTKGGGAFFNALNGGTIQSLLEEVTFENNTAAYDGGGFCSMSQSLGSVQLTFDGCAFTGNGTPQKGGAFFNWVGTGGNSSFAFNGCVFQANEAGVSGGVGHQFSRGGAGLMFAANDCEFTGNSAPNGGALMQYASGGTINTVLARCLFSENYATAGNGGGVQFYSEYAGGLNNASINGAQFLQNGATTGGALSQQTVRGGLATVQCDASRMIGNQATQNAGAVYHYTLNTGSSSTAHFTNCVFHQNTANKSGGALYINPNGSLPMQSSLTNCTLYGNSAGTGGCLFNIAATAASNLSLLNCIARNNPSTDPTSRTFQNVGATASLTFTHNLLDAMPCTAVTGGNGGLFCGNGNSAGQPLFLDAANGDFRLGLGSAARDAGLTAGAPTVDLNGTPRPQGPGIDMGAFEALFGQMAPEAGGSPNTWPSAETLEIFPNPAGQTVQLRANAPIGGLVQLFNSNGGTVVQYSLSEMSGIISVDVSGLPSGAYWVRWTCDEKTMTARLVVSH